MDEDTLEEVIREDSDYRHCLECGLRRYGLVDMISHEFIHLLIGRMISRADNLGFQVMQTPIRHFVGHKAL